MKTKFRQLALRGLVVVVFCLSTLLIGSAGLKEGLINKIKANVVPEVLWQLENQKRSELGLNELVINETLQKAAQEKAEDMAQNSYFAHTSPEGKTPWYWFKKVGYDFLYAGEILAVKFKSAESVEKAWMNSPTHRANILNGRFEETGIGIAKGVYKGVETEFVVQMFGTLLPSLDNFLKVVEN